MDYKFIKKRFAKDIMVRLCFINFDVIQISIMIKLLKKLPFLLFILFISLSANAQLSNSENNIFQMQEDFDNFRRTTDLNATKGWKWYARWMEHQLPRTTVNGDVSGAEIFLEEAIRVNAQKKSVANKNSGNWLPVGPDFLYPSNFPDRQHGMGRINCIAFHPSDPNTFWVGVAQGGIWKTTDSGISWTPLGDDLPIMRISDIAVDPNNPDTMYISIGDFAYIGAALDTDQRKRHTHYGLGVYKTTDGGINWSPTGLTFNQTDIESSLIRRVLIDPNNTESLVAAGVNGVYTSDDGGSTWAQKDSNLIWDLVQDPQTPGTIYAASGYLASRNIGNAGILKSVDFGQNWTTLNTNIPVQNSVQRIKLAISPSDPNYIYGLACGMSRGFYALYRSTDAGTTWTEMSSAATGSPNVLHWGDGGGSGGQGTYDLSLLVDPANKDRIYTGGINIWGSDDGGATWKGVSYWLGYYGPSVHADQHFFAHNPLDDRFYMCHDGGLSRTDTIGLETWANINNGANWPTVWENLSDMQITSYYRVGLCDDSPEYLVAGSQDNSTTMKKPNSWLNVIGGDGMDCDMHNSNPQIVYGSAQYGNFYRSSDGGQNFNYISGGINDDGGWTTPILMDETNNNALYLGYGDLWYSFNQGDTWNKISDFPDMPGFSIASPISDFDVDFPNSNAIYVASRPYFSRNTLTKFHVTLNGGSTWDDRSTGLPDSLYITSVECGRGNNDKVYVALGGFSDGEKVFVTDDNGLSWTNISYNLPNIPCNVIVHQEGPLNNLYLGTDIGVYFTNDTMNSWQLFSTNLPNVIVSDLQIDTQNDELHAATFGRGLWVSDISQPATNLEENFVNQANPVVYPNPSNGDFSISFSKSGEMELSIVDVMGREVLHRNIEFKEGQDLSLNLANTLKPGMYYLKFGKGNTYVVRKIHKQ